MLQILADNPLLLLFVITGVGFALGQITVRGVGLGVAAILFVGIAFATLLLAYFYLRLENPVWPPPGLTAPGLAGGALGAAIMLASGAAIAVALVRLRSGDQRGFVGGLVATLVLGAAAVVVAFRDVADMAISGNAHAYGSIVHTLTGFVLVIAVAALIMVTMTTVWARRGQYDRRRYAPVINIVRFYAAAVVVWLVGFGTVYLGPVLT